ncbi:MAG TPA: threonine--tRNA ligase [Acidimicrobiales bacterium]|jgi:threonyl-tRNA synthetase
MDVPDHRRLGRQLGIFATDEACGSGLPLWLPAGAAVRGEIERFIVELERRHGYQHVYTPEMAKRELYERSGHWAHYRDEMYPPMDVGSEQVVLRPMNCPHHILVYEAEPRGVRDLPFRLAELGTMFRFERSGVVGGLSRTRQMTLNDGHVFCAESDVESEIGLMLDLVAQAYAALGIPLPSLRLSRHGRGDKYVDDEGMWERGEAMIRAALVGRELAFTEAEGEAAFYGPKIDLQVSDPQGREETLSTIQVDFYLPERFDLWFRHGEVKERPVMVHRSIVSTMERMVAHLLEVHNGALPVWLSPVQVVVLPVGEGAGVDAHAVGVREALRVADVRVELDDRDETLGARVRQAQQRKVPYAVVVGDREAADGSVAVRLRGGEQLGSMARDRFVRLVSQVARERRGELELST